MRAALPEPERPPCRVCGERKYPIARDGICARCANPELFTSIRTVDLTLAA